MQKNIQPIEVKDFEIIFEKLAEAKEEQGLAIIEDINLTLEETKTIMLFREFQDSFMQPSYSTFTKS